MIDATLSAKNTRALQLLTAHCYGGWNNAEFWEAQQLLSSVPERDMTPALVRLMAAWERIEADRIDRGTHEPCSPELEASITTRWPVAHALRAHVSSPAERV